MTKPKTGDTIIDAIEAVYRPPNVLPEASFAEEFDRAWEDTKVEYAYRIYNGE
jgi:hypothetical protein